MPTSIVETILNCCYCSSEYSFESSSLPDLTSKKKASSLPVELYNLHDETTVRSVKCAKRKASLHSERNQPHKYFKYDMMSRRVRKRRISQSYSEHAAKRRKLDSANALSLPTRFDDAGNRSTPTDSDQLINWPWTLDMEAIEVEDNALSQNELQSWALEQGLNIVPSEYALDCTSIVEQRRQSYYNASPNTSWYFPTTPDYSPPLAFRDPRTPEYPEYIRTPSDDESSSSDTPWIIPSIPDYTPPPQFRDTPPPRRTPSPLYENPYNNSPSDMYTPSPPDFNAPSPDYDPYNEESSPRFIYHGRERIREGLSSPSSADTEPCYNPSFPRYRYTSDILNQVNIRTSPNLDIPDTWYDPDAPTEYVSHSFEHGLRSLFRSQRSYDLPSTLSNPDQRPYYIPVPGPYELWDNASDRASPGSPLPDTPDSPESPSYTPPHTPVYIPYTDYPGPPDYSPTRTPDFLRTRFPDSLPEDIPDSPPENIPDSPPVEIPDSPPVEIPDSPPIEIPDSPPVEIPDSPPEDTPDSPPEEIPDSPPEDTPDSPPEDTPNSALEDTPDSPAENTSDSPTFSIEYSPVSLTYSPQESPTSLYEDSPLSPEVHQGIPSITVAPPYGSSESEMEAVKTEQEEEDENGEESDHSTDSQKTLAVNYEEYINRGAKGQPVKIKTEPQDDTFKAPLSVHAGPSVRETEQAEDSDSSSSNGRSTKYFNRTSLYNFKPPSPIPQGKPSIQRLQELQRAAGMFYKQETDPEDSEEDEDNNMDTLQIPGRSRYDDPSKECGDKTKRKNSASKKSDDSSNSGSDSSSNSGTSNSGTSSSSSSGDSINSVENENKEKKKAKVKEVFSSDSDEEHDSCSSGHSSDGN